MKKGFLVVLLLSILSFATVSFAQNPSAGTPEQGSADLANAPFRNADLPIDKRVDDLVSRMTLEEKVSQMVHTAAAIPRLGIPEYNWWSEGLHGAAREGYATVFPQAIGLAATFDPDLLHQEAGIIATEFRAKYYARMKEKGYSDWFHGLTVWSPNINIFRDPRWGRGQETYGEDPFLTAQMGVAYVTGLQGNDPRYLKALSTPKHFAVHSGPEPTRHEVDVKVSDHDLEDTYLPAFRATVTAGAGSVMCAYNAIDGKPACAQPMLLQEHLRDDWHFQGYVVSDCGAASDIALHHHYTKTLEQGMADAVKSGMDIICAWPAQQISMERDAVLKAAQTGLLSKEDIDRAVKRLFTARMKLGMFDPPEKVPFSRITMADNDTEEHRQLALKAARETLVLLKNSDHLLPLTKKYKTIAVIGPNADSVDPLLGNYNGTPSKPVTILAGIKKRFGADSVIYAQGSSLTGPPVEPVPGDALKDNSGQPGLTAEYFHGTLRAGTEGQQQTPVMTRTDREINFSWSDGASPELKEDFSVRWTGTLMPPATGDYLIGFTGTDAFHFWLDNQLIGESLYSDTSKTRLKTVHLEAGHAYPVKIECSQEGSSGLARLVWHEPSDKNDYTEAVQKADLIVAVLGLAGELEGEEMPIHIEGFAGGDRTSIDLPRAQQELLENLVASGKPVVLVLMNGSALAVNWADQHVPAILEAWYPGEEGGNAVAEALAGDFSPAGKLPLTFYKSVDQIPAFDDYDMKGRTYRYFTREPLYPFGYGLSYTNFEYSNLSFDKNPVRAKDDVVASVDVKNAGSMASDEVVEIYLAYPNAKGAPLRALAGFKRVHLEAGETQQVQITIPNRNLSFVDETGARRIAPGTVQVWAGGGQPVSRTGLPKAAGVSGSFRIAGSAVLPK
ncbi:MAG TPA: glycoside hydrolase family 3 C-terminal domain-containing protein [Terriglobales bacterium]|nr:glycoside hydrolase family 3 C-terminal domain-containing protein [Terriglobales bacterium]